MLDKLIQILKDQVLEDPGHITETTALIEDLGLTSLDLVNLACSVEDEFDVEIPDRMIREFRTVGDVIRFLDAAE